MELVDGVVSEAGPRPHGWVTVDLGCGSGLCGRLFRGYCDPKAPVEAPAEALGLTKAPQTECQPIQPGPGVAPAEAQITPAVGLYETAASASSIEGRGKMIGCDLSPKMCAQAAKGGAYDEVRCEDILCTLSAQADHSVDLILSADTFIYVGNLHPCFSLAQAKLKGARSRACGGGVSGESGPGEEGWGKGGLLCFSVETLMEGSSFLLRRSGRFAHSEAYIEGLAAEFGFKIAARKAIVVRKEQGVPIHGLIFLLYEGREA